MTLTLCEMRMLYTTRIRNHSQKVRVELSNYLSEARTPTNLRYKAISSNQQLVHLLPVVPWVIITLHPRSPILMRIS